jgi:hypothetical protein
MRITGDIGTFPIPISLPSGNGLVAHPYLSDVFLKHQDESVESRLESQRYLVDLCGGMVPVLDTEPRPLVRMLFRFGLVATVFVVSITLWVETKVVDMEHAMSIMTAGLATIALIKWLLEG